MRLIKSFAIFASITSVAFGAAIEPRTYTDCEEIGDFDHDAFLDELFVDTVNQVKGLRRSQCLFGSKGTDISKLQEIAQDKNFLTIWDIFWEIDLYDGSVVDHNPLRCILNNTMLAQQYYTGLSGAFAQVCKGTITVLVHDVNNLSASLDGNGIWPISVNTMLTIGRKDEDIKVVAYDGTNAVEVYPSPNAPAVVEKHYMEPKWWYNTRAQDRGGSKQLQAWYGGLRW